MSGRSRGWPRHSNFDDIVLGQRSIQARIGTDGTDMTLSVLRNGGQLVYAIRLGLSIDDSYLGGDCSLEQIDTEEITASYTMRSGKATGPHQYRHEATQLIFRDRTTGRRWGIDIRIATDGLAFRYVLPDDARTVRKGEEFTRISLADHMRAWLLAYQTWYETPRFAAKIPELQAGDYGFPCLVRSGETTYALLTESGIDGRWSGAHLRFDREANQPSFTIKTADAENVVPGGSATPWRVLILGDLAAIVSSNFVDELAPEADDALVHADWVRPGRAAWSWWSDRMSPANLTTQQHYVDFASAHGWEYVLLDNRWDPTWVPELVSYASQRGVQIHLWSHWKSLNTPEKMTKLAVWKSWGVAGVKVDFMESESQERYSWYDQILAETARIGLMVNFHGSVIPRGWARTYPHVMGYEAVRGAEYYPIDKDSPTPSQNVIQPFTRNVVGSMDYTPVTFSATGRETTDGHELGMSVVFECGITHFADDILEYEKRPLADTFLAEVAPFWEETRLLSGTPDTEALMARRNGDRWFIGCIATGPARVITLDGSGLLSEPYDIWLVTDANQSDMTESSTLSEVELSAQTGAIDVGIAQNGGFAGIIVPTGTGTRRSPALRQRHLR